MSHTCVSFKNTITFLSCDELFRKVVDFLSMCCNIIYADCLAAIQSIKVYVFTKE